MLEFRIAGRHWDEQIIRALHPGFGEAEAFLQERWSDAIAPSPPRPLTVRITWPSKSSLPLSPAEASKFEGLRLYTKFVDNDDESATQVQNEDGETFLEWLASSLAPEPVQLDSSSKSRNLFTLLAYFPSVHSLHLRRPPDAGLPANIKSLQVNHFDAKGIDPDHWRDSAPSLRRLAFETLDPDALGMLKALIPQLEHLDLCRGNTDCDENETLASCRLLATAIEGRAIPSLGLPTTQVKGIPMRMLARCIQAPATLGTLHLRFDELAFERVDAKRLADCIDILCEAISGQPSLQELRFDLLYEANCLVEKALATKQIADKLLQLCRQHPSLMKFTVIQWESALNYAAGHKEIVSPAIEAALAEKRCYSPWPG